MFGLRDENYALFETGYILSGRHSAKPLDSTNKDYANGNFVATTYYSEYEKGKRAGYGFHNEGAIGAYLYLDGDGKLKYTVNGVGESITLGQSGGGTGFGKYIEFTSSTSMKYTGLSVTIPANCCYSITARHVYGNINPTGVAISNNTSSAYSLYCVTMGNGHLTVTLSGITGAGAANFYIFASAAGNNLVNGMYVGGFYFPKV